MLIRHIDVTQCPHCSSEICAEEVSFVHTNGRQKEFRKFRCGYKLSYNPNFSRMEVVDLCEKSEDYLAINKKNEFYKESLYKLSDSIDSSKTEKLKSILNYVSFY